MKTTFVALLCLLCSPLHLNNSAGSDLLGIWKFVPEKSTDLSTWRSRALQLEISEVNDHMMIVHNWMERGKVAFADSFAFVPGGPQNTMSVNSAIWPDNWFMGVLALKGSSKTISGAWLEPGSDLRVVTTQPVQTSQGDPALTTTRQYRLHLDGKGLTITERRSTRQAPVILVFERLEATKP